MAGATTSVLGTGAGGEVAAVKEATGGLLNITAKFIVPIGCLGAGWATGAVIGWKLGDFLCNFIPGIKKIGEMVAKKDASICVVHLLGGAIVIGAGIAVAYIAKHFFGDSIIGEILFRGILGYCIGAGVHTMIDAFGPLDKAITQATGG